LNSFRINEFAEKTPDKREDRFPHIVLLTLAMRPFFSEVINYMKIVRFFRLYI